MDILAIATYYQTSVFYHCLSGRHQQHKWHCVDPMKEFTAPSSRSIWKSSRTCKATNPLRVSVHAEYTHHLHYQRVMYKRYSRTLDSETRHIYTLLKILSFTHNLEVSTYLYKVCPKPFSICARDHVCRKVWLKCAGVEGGGALASGCRSHFQ